MPAVLLIKAGSELLPLLERCRGFRGKVSEVPGIADALTQLDRQRFDLMIVGADEDIRPTRNRERFFRFIAATIGEISIRDTLHEDAQYPTEQTLRAFEDNPDDSEEAQIAFVSALASSAFSLAATGGIDFAWRSFEDSVASGKFFNARRK